MNHARIGSEKQSGIVPAQDRAAADEKQLLSELTERARNLSLGTGDITLLVKLLAIRLSRVLAQPQDPDRLEAYGERLQELEPSTILAVFEQAERECRFFPQIAELLEMAGSHGSQLELMSFDRAWFWINTYVKKHGVEGRDYVESESIEGECRRCQGTRWIRRDVEIEKNGKVITARDAVRCDCRHVTLREKAPEIPPRLKATLKSLAPSIESGLERILECEPKRAGYLRSEFNEAYKRAGMAQNLSEQAG